MLCIFWNHVDPKVIERAELEFGGHIAEPGPNPFFEFNDLPPGGRFLSPTSGLNVS
jgi:hypothetical protein